MDVVTQMLRESGSYVDLEDVHDFLKLRVGKLAQEIVSRDGEILKSLGPTTKLSTATFEFYVEEVGRLQGFGSAVYPSNEGRAS